MGYLSGRFIACNRIRYPCKKLRSRAREAFGTNAIPAEFRIRSWHLEPGFGDIAHMSGHLRQLAVFCTVGLVCFCFSVAVLAGLHEWGGVNYLIAFVLAFVLSNITGYLLNAMFTFAVKSDHSGAARYIMINAVLLGANTAAMKLLVDELRIWYIAAAIALAAVNAPVSFLAQRLITYRPEIPDRTADP